MNCEKAERWLSASLDGELSPRRQAWLQAHLAACPRCRELESAWRRVGSVLKERAIPAGPDPVAAWWEVRRAIRTGAPEAEQGWIFGSRWRWAWATVTLLLVVGGGWWLAGRPGGTAMIQQAQRPVTEVEWVETDLPGATSVVYQDAETGCAVIWIVEAEESKDDHAG